MSARTCTIELFVGGVWRVAGQLRAADAERGIASHATFAYDFDYLEAMDAGLGATDARAVSCRYPLGYDDVEGATWPAFLLDVMPAGAARRYWESILGLPNNASSDWEMLVRGAGNPTGNVRVREAVDESGVDSHPGFARQDVTDRHEGFVEYARANGAPVSGSTGAGGDSPKFLLREDKKGRWHADGALSDKRTKRCWLVKFPRTPESADRLILRAEAGYHAVAKSFGIRTGGVVTWEADCLFMPRFDRVTSKGARPMDIERLGLESLDSLAGIADYGLPLRKEIQAAALARFASDPKTELREFLLRDVLDVALGNTDNHARNTSVSKTADGHVALSPLYDFAPMFLDRRMIARVSRWADNSDFPDWRGVVDALAATLEPVETLRWLRSLAPKVLALPAAMKVYKVPPAVSERCEARITRVARQLEELRA